MSRSIIRGKYVIVRTLDRHNWEQIEDGAVLEENGLIAKVGSWSEVSAGNPDVAVVGTGREVLLPGFVNGHHHIGLTPVQLGSPDMPLEQWFATRLMTRSIDLYLDTLYSAFEMISSGITTVQHIHGWAPGGVGAIEAKSDQVIKAYEDIGMRVSYCYALRDQNHLVYEENEAFLARVPEEIRPMLKRHFGRFGLTAADSIALFANLRAKYDRNPRVRIQLAPANLHWCTDSALEQLAEASERYDAAIHMHLVESAYQKEYARRRGGGTALDYIDRFGLLGPKMTLGHGVWLNEKDIDRIAETGTHICHNCSSNLRLRSGIAPLNRFEAKGINVAIGLDEAGINDDRDMLQEMRMVLRVHREPGMDDGVPTVAQVLRMATVGGAATTSYGETIGTLEVGKSADMVLIDWDQISQPYLDAETPVLDAVIQRAKVEGVKSVLVAGELIYSDRKFLKVDRDAAMKQLSEILRRDMTEEDLERRRLSKLILPYVTAFYDNYIEPRDYRPYYLNSSNV